jgi:SSS family solute:Na+ symporter
MKLSFLDWAVIVAYFAAIVGIALYYRKKAGASTSDFFVSGRDASWWLAGTSMVATTFAADTPLAVTGLVVREGIAGNWLWWSLLLNGMMTVFFFARLWRRAEIVTDLELVEIRYSGKPAAFLRGFRAVYFGVIMNCLILGWVNLAMMKILGTTLAMPKFEAMLVCLFITGLYTTISGVRGVLWTAILQFVLPMVMVIVLAFYSVGAVGGLGPMKAKLAAIDAARQAAEGGTGSILSFIPDLSSPWMPLMAFLVYLGVNWWANWYPGAEPGGGGYVAQRMFCAKDEKNSLWATFFFNVAHYALRPWPWVITALAAAILYPSLSLPGADAESGYIRVWVDYLPAALRGLMLAGFAGAYMSTVATQLNWGSSYIINDFYRRFLVRTKNEKHYVLVGRISTLLLMVLGGAVAYVLQSVAGTWTIVMGFGAGTGAVYLLRWYWWRINAWSEIVAMVVAAVVQILLQTVFPLSGSQSMVFAKSVLITVAITSVAWLVGTYVTKPESNATLLDFYRRTRPDVYGWGHIARQAPEIQPVRELKHNSLDWVLGCLLVYMALFGIGKLLLGPPLLGVGFLVISAAAGFGIYYHFSRRGWETLSGG